jgi:5'-3' exonuclease
MQILTGDSADNIIGLKGIGPVKAEKILEGAVDECEMYQRCVEAYDGVEERVIENAHLLFLRRHEGQIWKPPTQTN